MSEPDPTISKLLRLKRYEQPEEEFERDFLREFHLRQRAQLQERSESSSLVTRFMNWLTAASPAKWTAASLAAITVVTLITFKQTSAPNATPTLSHNLQQVTERRVDALPIERFDDSAMHMASVNNAQLPIVLVAGTEF